MYVCMYVYIERIGASQVFFLMRKKKEYHTHENERICVCMFARMCIFVNTCMHVYRCIYDVSLAWGARHIEASIRRNDNAWIWMKHHKASYSKARKIMRDAKMLWNLDTRSICTWSERERERDTMVVHTKNIKWKVETRRSFLAEWWHEWSWMHVWWNIPWSWPSYRAPSAKAHPN
jgi:hypothetical protein